MDSAPADGLRDARAGFHVPGPGPYALSHSVGCLPRDAAAALQSALLAPWADAGGDAWPDWLAAIGRFNAALAGLFGGEPAQWCPQVNLSSALTKVLHALPAATGGRDVALASEDCFPSMAYVLAAARAAGLRLRLVPRTVDPADPEGWRRALDAPDVRVALVTHVHSNTGAVAPIDTVARLCRERDVLSIVDVAQSAGVLPLDVGTLRADVVLGSCVKWLCGGPGAGFLWIAPQRLPALAPVDLGWFSHARPFDGDPHAFEFAPDARRFWGGTPSIAPYVLATAGLEHIAALGVARIHAHNRALKQALADALPARLRAGVTPERVGGTLCLPLGETCDAVVAALRARGVRFDVRGRTVRLSFHVYNTRQDVETVAEAIAAGVDAAR